MATSSFQHPALDTAREQFRTIRLVSSSPDSKIRCTMLVCNLDDQSPSLSYIALSYMWGTDDPTTEIIVDNSPFSIRSNLAEFLKRAQNLTNSQPIFIDALCINQNDIDERNRQVKLMGKIYSNASKVISWLGSGNERVDGGIPFIKQFFPLSNGLLRDFYKGKESDIRQAQQPWNLVHLFVNLRYWTRVWMVQEILKARKILFVYGDHSIDGEQLSQFAQELRGTIPCPAPLAGQLFESRCFNYLEGGSKKALCEDGSGHQPKLINVLWEYAHSACGEKRDRVYALLSLAQEGSQFPVDYAVSLTALYHQVWQYRPRTGVHLMAFAKHIVQAILDSPGDIDELKDSVRPRAYRFQLCPVQLSQDSKPIDTSSANTKNTLTSIEGSLTLQYQMSCDGPLYSLRTETHASSNNHAQPNINVKTTLDISSIKKHAFRTNDQIFNLENSGLLVVCRRDTDENGQNTHEIIAELSLSVGLSHIDGSAEVTGRWLSWPPMLVKMQMRYPESWSVESMTGPGGKTEHFLCLNEMALRVFMMRVYHERRNIQISEAPKVQSSDKHIVNVSDEHGGTETVQAVTSSEVHLLSVNWYMPTGEYSLNEVTMLQEACSRYLNSDRKVEPEALSHAPRPKSRSLSMSTAIHALTRLRLDLSERDEENQEEKYWNEGTDRDQQRPLPWRELLESEDIADRLMREKISNLFY